MIRKLLVILGHVGVIFFFIAFISVMGSLRPKEEQKTPEASPPAVFYQTVEKGQVNMEVFAQGEVQPKTEIALTAQVGGRIVGVSDNFADGGVIAKGQSLVQIERADYQVAVTRSQAALAQAEQALKLEEAEATLARKDYEELGGLESGGEPSALALREPQLNQAKANYEAAKADLAGANLSLSRTTIRAPFTGRVRTKNADIGQFVSPGFQVGQIFATDVAEIRLALTDSDLAQLNLPVAFAAEGSDRGPLVKLSTAIAGQTRNWTGHIVRTDAAVDPTTRQISAIVEVKDPYGEGSDNGFPLAMGLFVDAMIEGRQLENATVIPAVSLQGDDTVYVVDAEDKIAVRPVTVIAAISQGIIITDGLKTGDKLVVSRLAGVRPGGKVTPLEQGQGTIPADAFDGSATAAAADTGTGAVQ